jgi:2-keto-4-pentenoate hydratase
MIAQLAAELLQAEQTRVPVDPITQRFANLGIAEAYAVQLAVVKHKLQAGRKVAGRKIGLTSLAMQQMLGVYEPDYGHLLDSMMVEHDGMVAVAGLIQPRIEGEIAFQLARDLRGPGLTPEAVRAATDYVVPALEIIDSRIRNWQIKLIDTVADNASSGMCVVGASGRAPQGLDLPALKMSLRKNGQEMAAGDGAAVMGDPAAAVAWLGNKLAEFGITMGAGEVILSGALCKAIDVAAGDVIEADFGAFGSARVRFA